jgi:hypothetical protein
VLVPPALAFACVQRYGVDVLRIDDWSMAWLFTRIETGSLSLADLVQQHNEIRPLFPRLLLIALAELFGYDARHAMFASLALCALVACNLAWMGRQTLPGPRHHFAALALASALLFSPVNSPNWLWAVQVVMFLTLAALSTALAVGASRAGAPVAFAVAAACAGVATWSMSAGLLCWVVLPPALALARGPRLGPRGRWAAGWALAAGACLLAYFAGYRAPESLPSPWRALARPDQLLAFLLAYLGAPFAAALAGDRSAALFGSLAAGALLAALLAAACLWLWRRRADAELARRAAPWLGLAAFAVGSGILAGIGRSGMGLHSALATRYATWALFLPIALVHLGALALAEAPRRGDWLRPGAAALAAAVLALAGAHSASALRHLERLPATREQHLAARALVAFVNAAPEREALERLVFPWLDRLTERANALDRQGLLSPPLVASDRVAEIAGARGAESYGAIDRSRVGKDEVAVAGFALLPGRGEPAHAVLLCAEGAEGDPRVVAVVTGRAERPDVVRRTGRRADLRSGFARRLPRARLPAQATALTAWAFDALDYRAYRLEGEVPLAAPGRANATTLSPRRVPIRPWPPAAITTNWRPSDS